MTTLENQLLQAEKAAKQARDKIESLRAEQQQKEEKVKAARAKAKTEFEKTRSKEFTDIFDKKVEETRNKFHAAVAAGTDPTATWIAYVKAQKAAAAEYTHIENRKSALANKKHRDWEAKIKAWNARLNHAHDYGSGQIDEAALAEINNEIREALTQAGMATYAERFTATNDTYRVELRAVSKYRLGSISRAAEKVVERKYQDFDYNTALNRAVELATATTIDDWRTDRDTALQAAGGGA